MSHRFREQWDESHYQFSRTDPWRGAPLSARQVRMGDFWEAFGEICKGLFWFFIIVLACVIVQLVVQEWV
jgi:hypothetical protein